VAQGMVIAAAPIWLLTFMVVAMAALLALLLWQLVGSHADSEKQLSQPPAVCDAFGHEQLGGVGERLAAILKAKTGFEVRVTNPAYMQRGGIPAAYGRFIAIELGERAVDLVHNRRLAGWRRSRAIKLLRWNSARPRKQERSRSSCLKRCAGFSAEFLAENAGPGGFGGKQFAVGCEQLSHRGRPSIQSHSASTRGIY
jgi:hypothetical protein